MKIHAYQEIYLSHAQSALGDAFDYAINTCKIPGDNFIQMLLSSSVCKKLENGEPDYLAGKSGIEIARAILEETTGKQFSQEQDYDLSRSPEYWIGCAVAYYQWYSDRRYNQIFEALPYQDLEKMYYILHEADVSKFADIAESRIKEVFPDTNLKRIRTLYGCSQSELARRSQVSLRSIQMYEQRQKDINKASAETVYRLSKVLGCTVEELIER